MRCFFRHSVQARGDGLAGLLMVSFAVEVMSAVSGTVRVPAVIHFPARYSRKYSVGIGRFVMHERCSWEECKCWRDPFLLAPTMSFVPVRPSSLVYEGRFSAREWILRSSVAYSDGLIVDSWKSPIRGERR